MVRKDKIFNRYKKYILHYAEIKYPSVRKRKYSLAYYLHPWKFKTPVFKKNLNGTKLYQPTIRLSRLEYRNPLKCVISHCKL
jgi:hypothetical protein